MFCGFVRELVVPVFFEEEVKLFESLSIVAEFFCGHGAIEARLCIHVGAELRGADEREISSCAFKVAELVERHCEVIVQPWRVGGIFVVRKAFEEGVAGLFVI